MKITRRRYVAGFFAVAALLAIVRCVFPGVAADRSKRATAAKDTTSSQQASVQLPDAPADSAANLIGYARRSRFYQDNGQPVKSRIYSVPGYSASFPDQNDVQLMAAQRWGVSPVTDSKDAERRKSELVFVGSNPYFYVDRLKNSIPYLVPRASLLLQDIGQTFFDSLQVKRIPLHKIIVTSVMRSKADVEKLRGHNRNATVNSCHLYGTTFDVCYNRYKTVEAPDEPRREVRNDTLKYVLAEVLRDMRESGRCYVKYEVHQGCWHITVR